MAYELPRRTLATRLENRDRARFVGRDTELAFLDRCMREDPPASVVHICGSGGIGKSALLRAAARRARAIGWEVVTVDGRELGPASAALEDFVRKAAELRDGDRGGPLILLDSYEQISSLDGYLRRDLLPTLPDRALVVIASRGEPDLGWFSGGWEAVTARIDLHGLSEHEALRLLAAHGLADERAPAIVDWAGGSPLALSLAAATASADTGWNAETDLERPEMLRSLIHRLAHSELRDVRMSALCIAAIARTTTPELLSAVLPRDEGELAYAQLCELTVTEPLGDGITLHELVRKALLADLRMRNQDLERFLRRRIIDYLYERTRDDQPLLIIDMAHLVENPVMKWGFGWQGDVGYRVDTARDGDADRIERKMRASQNWQWWQLTRRFFADAPDRVAVVRDLNDKICGYMACMSLATAPEFAGNDPLIGPWLAHARAHASRGESVLWHAAVDFTGTGKVQAMLGMAGVLRSGSANSRFAYLPIDTSYPGALAFAQAIGAQHVRELDAEIGGVTVECHRLDYGPGGLIAFVRAQVYAEIGLPAPETISVRLAAASTASATSASAASTSTAPASTAPAGTASTSTSAPASTAPASTSASASTAPASTSASADTSASASADTAASASTAPASTSASASTYASASTSASAGTAASAAADTSAGTGPGLAISGTAAPDHSMPGIPGTRVNPAPGLAADPGPAVDEAATTSPAPPPAPPAPPPQQVADLNTVREALKRFRVPRDLARSPLATGGTVAERAESVRRLIRAAARDAFGDSEAEKLLYNVLVAGYLEPMRSHEEAANKLLLSRAAYFRRLRTAVERVAEQLAEQRSA